MATLADRIAALLPQATDNPAALLELAVLLRKDNQPDRAVALCQEALALVPAGGELALQARAFLSNEVPGWHFLIVRDALRNAAYDAALRRAIRPGMRVLEIGSGTGLLAMMAARAGAAEVITCEMNPAVARAASQIIARNGYADRVRVIAKHSGALDADADLGGKVDVLVSEIVSNDLLGEDVLSAHEPAVRDLLKRGGHVIPARGIVRIALAEDQRLHDQLLGETSGFDLSAFNNLAPPVRKMRTGDARLQLRGDAVDFFAFDFASSQFCAPARTAVNCRAFGGPVNGIVQWIALEMDTDTRYENRPAPGATSCWAALFHPLPHPIDTVPGQEIRICGAHDRHQITIWPDAK